MSSYFNIYTSIYFKTNQHTSIVGECLDALYDVTIAYPDKKPLTEHDIAQGMFPSEIHFHIKRSVTRKKYGRIILYILELKLRPINMKIHVFFNIDTAFKLSRRRGSDWKNGFKRFGGRKITC